MSMLIAKLAVWGLLATPGPCHRSIRQSLAYVRRSPPGRWLFQIVSRAYWLHSPEDSIVMYLYYYFINFIIFDYYVLLLRLTFYTSTQLTQELRSDAELCPLTWTEFAAAQSSTPCMASREDLKGHATWVSKKYQEDMTNQDSTNALPKTRWADTLT